MATGLEEVDRVGAGATDNPAACGDCFACELNGDRLEAEDSNHVDGEDDEGHRDVALQ